MATEVPNSPIPDLEWMPIDDLRKSAEPTIHSTLLNIPLFENLSSKDWQYLSGLFHQRSYGDDEAIFEYGTPGLGMYIIIEGQVKVFGVQDNREVQLSQLGPGDFFGEMSLIDEIERSATTRSVGITKLIGIFRPHLKELIRHRPKLGVILLERLARIMVLRLREANILLAKACLGDPSDDDRNE